MFKFMILAAKIGEVLEKHFTGLSAQASETLVNGRLHWLTQLVRHRRSIISFGLVDKQFREVPRPNCGNLNRHNYYLVALGGCLSEVVVNYY